MTRYVIHGLLTYQPLAGETVVGKYYYHSPDHIYNISKILARKLEFIFFVCAWVC